MDKEFLKDTNVSSVAEKHFIENIEVYLGRFSNDNSIIDLIEENLNEDIPNAIAVASDNKDRGAMRALVWNEKVTRILKSLLLRYQKQGNSMLVNTGIYVCTICGFIYIGDKLPELCPVCKVPNWKFEKIEGGKANV